MTIYPAIDIKAGRCVRLTQGKADQETVYSLNPAEVAAQFKKEGSAWVHVVDLDGAFLGEPQNLELAVAGAPLDGAPLEGVELPGLQDAQHRGAEPARLPLGRVLDVVAGEGPLELA